ncbi:MAG TPA: DUF5131 family protein [Streptosporangiaceae bacterium]|nr:DUF5131 family protein [Streptosporangiaceae bacterium]
MSTVSKIEWTEVTWNPTTGCDRISPGCDHCYALTLARRLKATGQAKCQQVGVFGEHGPVADRGRCWGRGGRSVGGGLEHGGVQAGVPVDERAVHLRAAGDRGDGDL